MSLLPFLKKFGSFPGSEKRSKSSTIEVNLIKDVLRLSFGKPSVTRTGGVRIREKRRGLLVATAQEVTVRTKVRRPRVVLYTQLKDRQTMGRLGGWVEVVD